MREIKFRAYMEDVNQDWTDEDSEDRFEMIYDFAYEEYNTVNDMLSMTGNLMQYTGLKDKNGVEIFENDILKVQIVKAPCEYKNPSNTYSRVLEYVNIEVSCIEGCFVLDSDFIPDDEKMIWLWDDIEVIGNIYENKELLIKVK